LSRIHCCSGTVLEFDYTQAAVRFGKGRIEARDQYASKKMTARRDGAVL